MIRTFERHGPCIPQVFKQLCQTDFHGHRPGQTDQRFPQRGALLSDIRLAGLIE